MVSLQAKLMAPADVCVTTRHAWRAQLQHDREPDPESRIQCTAALASGPSSVASTPPTLLPGDPPYIVSTPSSPLTDALDSSSSDDFWPPSSKRPRTQSATAGISKQKPRKTKRARSSNVTRDHTPAGLTPSSSRATSQHPSTSLEEPIYRTSRSRSASTFPTPPEMEENPDWIWWTGEDGSPGPDFTSAASVVRRLVKSYKSRESLHLLYRIRSCFQVFKNPTDPEDKSFEVDAMPCTELEYPNNNACET